MLYLYALCEGLTDLTGLVGVQGETLALVKLAELTAVGGWVEAAPGLEAATVVAQDRLVRSLHARAASLLPMRFGTTATDVRSAEQSLAPRVAVLREHLNLVRNREQMTIRVFSPAGSEPASPEMTSRLGETGAGRRYLESRATQLAPPRVLQTIAASAGELSRSVRIETVRYAGIEGSVYHLIDRGLAAAYRETVERAIKDVPGVHVIISGPAPPYAFADEIG